MSSGASIFTMRISQLWELESLRWLHPFKSKLAESANDNPISQDGGEGARNTAGSTYMGEYIGSVG